MTASALRFGRISTTSLTGLIDSVRLFNYARTAAQVAWDYNKGGPVGYWKMDECQGDRANDSSGNNNHGTITIGASGEDTIGICNTSSTAWGSGATGKRNSSLSLDGTDDYVDLGTSSQLNPTGSSLTLSAWVYSNTITGSSPRRVISRDADTTGSEPYIIYSLGLNSANQGSVSFELTTGGTRTFLETNANTISASAWYHVAAVYDGTNQIIYINGVNTTQGSKTGSITSSSGKNLIGIRDATSPKQFFNGQIDDARVYNYALTPTQVKTLYNNGAVNFAPLTGNP